MYGKFYEAKKTNFSEDIRQKKSFRENREILQLMDNSF
jgi:hypothetical protein